LLPRYCAEPRWTAIFSGFGQETRGRQTAPLPEAQRRGIAADGATGEAAATGASRVQEDVPCSAFPITLTNCSAVFRNPEGSQQENEYRVVCRWSRVELSVVA